jgi:hypothetical protein
LLNTLYSVLYQTRNYWNSVSSLFQNSVSFEKGFRKTGIEAGFSSKSKVDFPKTEVLENLLSVDNLPEAL